MLKNNKYIYKLVKEELERFLIKEGFGEESIEGWIPVGTVYISSCCIGSLPEKCDYFIYFDPNPRYSYDDEDGDFGKNFLFSPNPDSHGRGWALYNLVTPFYKRGLKYNIFPQFKNTEIDWWFNGKPKRPEDCEESHQELLSLMNIQGDKLIIKHNSNRKLTDGVVRMGERNLYSKGTPEHIYFWGSKNVGNDPSNGSLYTYMCSVDLDKVYDFYTDQEDCGSSYRALMNHQYIASIWSDKNRNSVVVCTNKPTPIDYIIDNSNGKRYDSDWNEI
jgi:hypothetical protein